MDIFLITFGGIMSQIGLWLFIIVLAAVASLGLFFSLMPPIPGPILTLLAMFGVHFLHPWGHFENKYLIWIMTAATIAVLIIENIIPMWATKKFGGSKAGIWGSTIGLIIGTFFLPFIPFPLNMLIGLFGGAMIGELLNNNDFSTALRSGFGSFIGFLAGNGLKLAVSIIMTVQMVQSFFPIK